MDRFIELQTAGRIFLCTAILLGNPWVAGADSVHHFEFNPIESPRRAGIPWSVVITARDASNGIADDFAGSVSLAANSGSDARSSTLLGNLSPQDFSYNYSYHGPVSAGFAFTPHADLVATHARHYSGGRVSIWTDAGVLLAARDVADWFGRWMETPFFVPVTLYAGHTYRVALWSDTYSYCWREDSLTNFADGIIGPSYTADADVLPQSLVLSRTWLLDLRYTAGGSRAVPIAPLASGHFMNGAWTGVVSVLSAAEDVRLRADDGQGHVGTSNPFGVHANNDLALIVSAPHEPLPMGDPFVFRVTFTNTGPSAATSIFISNQLSGPVGVLAATVSKGSAWIADNAALWSVGSADGATHATIQISAVASNSGIVALHSSLIRGEWDGSYDNNQVLAAVTIRGRPVLSIQNTEFIEGDGDPTNAVLAVQLSLPTLQTVTVDYATSPGSASAEVDFQTTSGTLVFAPGVTNLPISIPLIGDLMSESNEVFFVNLSGATNATISQASWRATINDDDPFAALTILDTAVIEDSGSSSNAVYSVTNAVFSVRLSAPSGRRVAVRYQTADASAAAGADYASYHGTLTFPPGSTQQTISVPVFGDITGESNETFRVTLYDPVNATIADNEGVGTIVDNDPLTLAIGDATVQEASGGSSASFVVSLSPPTNKPVEVFYATENVSAIAGEDYLPTNGWLIFPSGMTTQTLQVVILDNPAYEANEVFYVRLSEPVNSTILDGQGAGTITDDEPPPVLSVSSPSTLEGHGGATNLEFQVTLTGRTDQFATVHYATADGTAAASSDYAGASGFLTFPAGTTNLSVSVPVLGDRQVESNEVFRLILSGAAHASIADPGVGTILNDDGFPGQMHCFEWSAIPSPQRTGVVFDASILAKDFFGNRVADFNGAAHLFARTNSPTAPIFIEDFEDGNLDGWGEPWTNDYRYATNQVAPQGSSCLFLSRHFYLTHSLSNLTPNGVNFYVRGEVREDEVCRLILGTSVEYADLAVLFYMTGGGQMGLYEYSKGLHAIAYQPDQWYKISLWFHWEDRTVDYFVNDALIEAGIPFRNPAVDRLTVLRLFAYGRSWWDQIEILDDDWVPAPDMISPAVAGPFTNGVWAGNLALRSVAAKIYLGATNDDGFVGFSNPFEVSYPDDLILAAASDAAIVYAGETLAYTLQLNTTGPGTLHGIQLSNTLPAGVTFLSAAASQGDWSFSGPVVNWNVGALPADSHATLRIAVRVDSHGLLTNVAAARPSEPDLNPLNNTVALATRVLPSLHHFVFHNLSTTQQSLIPFPITVAARDLNNTLVSNFNGWVRLSATRLFKDDFEDGDIGGWSWSVSQSPREIAVTNSLGGANNQALVFSNLPGVRHEFPDLLPDEAAFKVRLAAPEGDLYCTLGGGPTDHQRIIDFRMTRNVMVVYYNGGSLSLSHPCTTDRWYEIRFQFHWPARTYDWFVDGTLASANIPFMGSDATRLTYAYLRNIYGCTSYWDDFELVGDAAAHTVASEPWMLGPFTNGLWTGEVIVQEPATNVQLRVEGEDGHEGLSATFNVIPGPHGVFDHFEWSLTGPHLANQPFAAALTAKDAFGITVTNYTGSVILRATTQKTVRVLFLHTYTDPDYTLVPLDVISNWFADFNATITTNATPSYLQSQLASSDVLLVARQCYAPAGAMAEWGRALEGVLTEFLRAGGIIIVCAGTGEAYEILNSSHLLECAWQGSGATSMAVLTDHILTADLPKRFKSPGLRYFFHTNSTVVLYGLGDGPVVLSRDVGAGHVVLFGGDMSNGYPSASPLDRVFANAVKWARFSPAHALGLSPTTAGPFSNGVWTGTVTIPDTVGRAFLHTDDGHLNAVFSDPFSVGVINDIGISMVLSNPLPIVGEPLQFLIALTNVGPNSATGVRLTNTIPAGTSLLEMTASRGNGFVAGNDVVWDVGTLEGDDGVSLALTLRAAQTGSFTNVASVTRAEPDYYLPNNTASWAAIAILPTAFYIGNATVVERNTDATDAVFEVRLYPPSMQTSLVHYATADGSAVASLDYAPTNGLLTFPPGVTNQSITVAVHGDLLSEDTEMFNVQLSNPTNALLGAAVGTGAIADDNDPFPLFSLDAASAFEGDAGTSLMVFTGRLSTGSGRTVTVRFATGNGAATPGVDFDAVAGQLVFPPGVTEQAFAMSIRGDTVNEPDEFFLVDLLSVSNATPLFVQTSGLIRNDDGLPGKLDHFELAPVLAPVVERQPFWLSVTARDAWNYALPDVSGPFQLDGYRSVVSHSDTVEILTWIGWVDNDRYPQILTAVSNWFTDFHETTATAYDPSVLEALLSDKDVLLVPPQEAPMGQMGVLGASWSAVLNPFVHRGGVVIVCSDHYDEHLLLVRGGFLELQRLGNDYSGNVAIGAPSRVTEGVSNSFAGPFVAEYAASNGVVALKTAANNHAVVIQREAGWGAVFMIGSGFYYPGSQMDHVLANAVRWNQGLGEAPVALTIPDASLILTNGAWAGCVTVFESGRDLSLRAADGLGRMGWSSPLNVKTDSDGDGLPDDWELPFGLDPTDPADAFLDADGDTLSNLAEYWAGTDPLSFESVLWLEAVPSGKGLWLRFPSVIGRRHILEYSASISPPGWLAYGSPFFGTGGLMEIEIPMQPGQAMQFYRLRLLP
ncbi:MAG TPA: Calx-beta domain-containing protein [Candidatus Paceibacterota bacterium]|nr:DUF11 domain-containing protein [Verrucomicrobiota bacterium]HOX03901.1 Calx-beta domain-containing protein [Verrucomicrobiota bacterium]HRZ46778.1 Calx-beta domain-containing protein [Candidatus Paceibacterota bacterium]